MECYRVDVGNSTNNLERSGPVVDIKPSERTPWHKLAANQKAELRAALRAARLAIASDRSKLPDTVNAAKPRDPLFRNGRYNIFLDLDGVGPIYLGWVCRPDEWRSTWTPRIPQSSPSHPAELLAEDTRIDAIYRILHHLERTV